jgi:hypothetical protein
MWTSGPVGGMIQSDTTYALPPASAAIILAGILAAIALLCWFAYWRFR